MVIFMHIDYNNSCTRVFRMCLMVIDMCIDKTFGFLGQIAPKKDDRLRSQGSVIRSPFHPPSHPPKMSPHQPRSTS